VEAVQAERAGKAMLRKGNFTCTGKKSEKPNQKWTTRGKNNLFYSFKRRV